MIQPMENQAAPFRTWSTLLYYLFHVTIEIKQKKNDFYDNKHYFV